MNLEELREKRNNCIDEGNSKKALEYSIIILDKYKKYIALQDWFLNGVILFQLGQYRDAIDNYNEALAIEPNNFQSIANIALCLLNIQEDEEAFRMFRKAFEIKNDIGPAWLGLGTYFLGKKERLTRKSGIEVWKKAVNCFRNAVRITPAFAHNRIYMPSEGNLITVENLLHMGESVPRMTLNQILTLSKN